MLASQELAVLQKVLPEQLKVWVGLAKVSVEQAKEWASQSQASVLLVQWKLVWAELRKTASPRTEQEPEHAPPAERAQAPGLPQVPPQGRFGERSWLVALVVLHLQADPPGPPPHRTVPDHRVPPGRPPPLPVQVPAPGHAIPARLHSHSARS